MQDLTIREVSSNWDLEAFIEAGHRAEAANPHWIAPVRNELKWVFDPKKSPLMRENKIRAFIALQGGMPVGRIATIVNFAYLQKYQNRCGHFGLLEAIDDPELFKNLIERAAANLRAEGMVLMQGPFSLSINHETGVLIEGFDRPHMVRTNHAPPYYQRHLEAAGGRKAMDLVAATCVIAESDFPAKVKLVAEKSRLVPPIKTYGLSVGNFAKKMPAVLELYNDAWADNWGSVPVSAAEGKMIADLMLPVSKPAWIRIAEWRAEPIAIVSQIPDVNEALKGLDGRLLPFGWAKLMWAIHVRGTMRTRIPMIGVKRKWRGSRVGSLAVSLLLAQAIEQAKKAGVVETEISWMLETNSAVRNLIRGLPAKENRRFRVYEFSL